MRFNIPDINKIAKFFAVFAVLSGLCLLGYGQTAGDYRTINNGNWNNSGIWQSYNGAAWVAAANYPGQTAGTGTVTIRNNHNVTLNVSPAFNIAALTIDPGANATALTFGAFTLNVTGDVNVNSTSNNVSKSIALNTGTFSCNNLFLTSSGGNDNRDAFVVLTSGTLNLTGNITMNAAAARTYIRFNGGGTVNIGGTITGGSITSANNGGTSAPTSGTVIYNGQSIQSVGLYTYYNLGVDNTNEISLPGDVTVNNTLTMTQGNISTGSFMLALSSDLAGALSRTSGTVLGRLRRAVSTTAGITYLFPVGTVTNYRPATMNFTSLGSAINVTAEFIETPPYGFTAYADGSVTLNSIFTDGYWRFVSSGTPAANYSLSLDADGFSSFLINANTRITGRDNSNTAWRGLGIHGTLSGNVITRTGISNLNTTFFDFGMASECSTAAMSYSFERDITVDYTQVEGGSDLYNFPMLMSLTGQSFLRSSPLGAIMNSSGYDIIFTDSDHNKLDHQIEYYNGTNGDLIAWVRIPVLSASSNTVIKMLYSNLQVTTDPSVTTVWDSHYKGVWHLNDINLEDVTEYDFSGTPYNTPSYSTGTIYNSLQMNGSDEYVQVNNDTNINFAGNITVSAWVNMDTRDRDQKIAGNQNNSTGGYKFGIYTNNKVEFEIRNSANTPSLNRDVSGGTTLNTGQWYYLAGISSDVLDSIKTFVNGVSERPFKKTGILGIASDDLVIGKEPFLSDYYFDGRFDELRISDKVRSDGWMRTEYNNQVNPSAFYSIGSQISLTELPSAGICNGPITLPSGYPAGGTYSGNPYISGNIFTPPSAGTYPIVYTYNGACGPASVAKNIVITPVPPALAAPDKDYCVNQITYLDAVGENIRWYSGGSLVSTANPFSTGQTSPGIYNYTVTQALNGCESPAAAVTLTIHGGISIITQPQSAAICEGSNASFSVSASGYSPTYRWEENGVTISDGGIYSGATTSTLTLTSPGIALNGRSYRCVVTSSCGPSTVTSGSALLTISPPLVATFNYAGTPYCPGAANPLPTFSGGGIAGTFTSTPGLVFVNSATGEINMTASTPGAYTVTNTIPPAGACGEVVATSPFEIISTLAWIGAVNSDWNNTGNWICGFIPNQSISVQIPDVTNKPVINSGVTAEAGNILIENGSSLTVASGTIIIHGSVTSSSGLDASDGTVEFAGSSAQSVGNNIFTGNTVMNLTVNNNAGVTLQGPLNVRGVVLVQNGTLASDGNLTLASDTTQTALIDGSGGGDVTGDVTMQRYLPSGFGYKYFSSPFQAATVSEFGDDMDLTYAFPLFYRFNENSATSGWINYTNDANVLNPLEGYAVNFGAVDIPNTADVTGVVNNGSLTATLYNHDSIYTEGFNLVGNPYPSPVDWDAQDGQKPILMLPYTILKPAIRMNMAGHTTSM